MNAPALSSVTHEETFLEARETAASSGALEHVPNHQRSRILSGMRWSFWLSTLAVGFGAAINFLLARCGPETLAVYGLLGVYIGMLTSLFYFGGDTVIMKFTPECKAEDRPSFILSYLGIILSFLLPFLLVGYLWPSVVRMVLGHDLDDGAAFVLLALAPVPVAFQVSVAGLKAMLEIKASQVLAKSLTLVNLCVYSLFVLFAPTLLKSYPRTVIWGAYLTLAAIAALIGGVLVYRACSRTRLRFFLPSGFWRYAVDTQAVSVTNFLAGRLDYLCLLNFGSMETLGRYVAILTVAMTVNLTSTLFMDTLLPSLTNMVASANERAAAQVFSVHMRILFLVSAAVSIGIMVMSVYVCRFLGPQYVTLTPFLVLATLFQAISVPGTYGGTLLASVGKQRPATLASIPKGLVFCVIFFSGRSQSLLGATVFANGLAAAGAGIVLMAAARIYAPFYPSVNSLWINTSFVECVVAALALYCLPLSFFTGVGLWIGAMFTLLLLGHYSWHELMSLSRIFLQGSKPAEAPALASEVAGS